MTLMMNDDDGKQLWDRPLHRLWSALFFLSLAFFADFAGRAIRPSQLTLLSFVWCPDAE
jgi:hypothetical protein